MSALAGGRVCIFCGGAPVTREHLWPQWLSRSVGDGTTLHVAQANERSLRRWRQHAELEGRLVRTSEPKGQSSRQSDHVVKVACRACNNGWMARLEAEAKPVLLRLMTSRKERPDPGEIDTLFRWLVKTTAVFEMDDPQSAVLPEAVRRSIAEPDLEIPGLWSLDEFWAPMDFYLSHGRAILLNNDGDIEYSMIQTIVVGHSAFVLQYRSSPLVGERPLRGLRRSQLLPQLESGPRPRVGLWAWGRLARGHHLFRVSPPRP